MPLSHPLVVSRFPLFIVQLLRLQEQSDHDVDDGTPQYINVEVYNDLCNSVGVGEQVTIVGVVRAIQESVNAGRGGASGRQTFVYYISAHSIFSERINEQLTIEFTKRAHSIDTERKRELLSRAGLNIVSKHFSTEDLQAIANILAHDDVISLIVASSCPNVHGHELVKLGLLLGLFGGSNAEYQTPRVHSKPNRSNVRQSNDPMLHTPFSSHPGRTRKKKRKRDTDVDATQHLALPDISNAGHAREPMHTNGAALVSFPHSSQRPRIPADSRFDLTMSPIAPVINRETQEFLNLSLFGGTQCTNSTRNSQPSFSATGKSLSIPSTFASTADNSLVPTSRHRLHQPSTGINSSVSSTKKRRLHVLDADSSSSSEDEAAMRVEQGFSPSGNGRHGRNNLGSSSVQSGTGHVDESDEGSDASSDASDYSSGSDLVPSFAAHLGTVPVRNSLLFPSQRRATVASSPSSDTTSSSALDLSFQNLLPSTHSSNSASDRSIAVPPLPSSSSPAIKAPGTNAPSLLGRIGLDSTSSVRLDSEPGLGGADGAEPSPATGSSGSVRPDDSAAEGVTGAGKPDEEEGDRAVDVPTVRQNIHVLVVGDPGVGKSQMLRAISALAPKSVFVSGSSSGATGLTAVVNKDKGVGGASLDAGALVLSDLGIAAIDEFDKLKGDHVSLLEAMEQQKVSIAKAGITTSLNARTGVLAAANPISGHFDRSKTISENLKLKPALLSRFDLIFILLDARDNEKDSKLSDHILKQSYANAKALSGQPIAPEPRFSGQIHQHTGDVDKGVDDLARMDHLLSFAGGEATPIPSLDPSAIANRTVSSTPSMSYIPPPSSLSLSGILANPQPQQPAAGSIPISMALRPEHIPSGLEFPPLVVRLQRGVARIRTSEHVPAEILKKYVAYAKKYCSPVLTPEAAKVLLDFYVTLRKDHSSKDGVPITTRQLESLCRLSEARAKMELNPFVLEHHARDIVELMKEAIFDAVSDGFGGLDFGRQSGVGISDGKAVKALVQKLTLETSRKGSDFFTVEEVRNYAASVGYSGTRNPLDLIEKMNNMGYITRTFRNGQYMYRFHK